MFPIAVVQGGLPVGEESGAKCVLRLHGIGCTIHLYSMGSNLTARQQELKFFLEERTQKGEPPPTYREICKRFGYKSPKAAFDHVVALEKKGVLKRGKGSARGIQLVQSAVGIRWLGAIPAGRPHEALTVTDERLNLDPAFCGIWDRSRAFALSVTGDSMIGRQIFDGDIVLFEHGVSPRNGDIVAALIDNESTIKTIVRQGGKVWLRAENPHYPDPKPAVEMQVQGVGRAVIRLLKK